MSRVVQFLAGVTVAAAATANVECGASNCSSCVGTAPAQVCVTYDGLVEAKCAATCGAGTLLNPPRCSAATGVTTECDICVPLLGGLVGGLGLCVKTTGQVAPYLSANSTINAGLNLNLFASVGLVTANVSVTGTVQVDNGNSVVVLPASTTPIVSLNAGASNNNIFQINSSLTVNSWNSAGSANVNNDGAELKLGSLTIGGSSSKFVVSQERSASASASAESSVSFGNINFGTGGTLRVAGGSAHFGGSATVDSNITGSGRVQLSGAVSVDGNIPAAVTVNVDASGSSAPLVTVNSGSTFNVSGDVIISHNGESSSMVDTKAVVVVNGVFVAGSASAKVQPKVVLNQAASFVISSAATFQAEAVEIGAQASLVIDRNVNRATLKIRKIARCAGTIQIRLTAEAFAAATVSSTSTSATGSVAFSYDNTNNITELVNCGVEVFDASNKKYTLTSRTSTQAAAGRRLLASEGTATWGSDQMTFNVEKQEQSSAPVSFAVVPLLMVGMAGLLF